MQATAQRELPDSCLLAAPTSFLALLDYLALRNECLVALTTRGMFTSPCLFLETHEETRLVVAHARHALTWGLVLPA